MTILPPVVLTTAQLVGGLVASAKNAHELVKGSSDHALKGAVSELYDSLLDVKARVLDLDEENRTLRTELARKDEIVGPQGRHGFFTYQSKPDHPLCPKCLQSREKNAVFLTEDEFYDSPVYRCIICNTSWDR